MDKLKGAVGLGGKHDEGQEPVSGAKGEGTTAEPFDAGNDRAATQAADNKTEDANASKSEPLSSSPVAEEQQPAKEGKKSGGGGFFKAIGLGGGKKKDEEQEAQAAEKQAEEKAEAEKHLPPNHLGSAVPEGASKDLADPGTVAPGQTDGIAAQQGTTGGSPAPQVSEPPQTETPRSPSTLSAGKQPDRGSSVGSSSGLSPDRARSTGGSVPALAGSRGEGRGSMVPANAPKYKRVENPDRIPIAGGKRIGEEQYQTRRASMAPPASPPRDMAKLDREGSPDPVTAENTEVNTTPTFTSPAAPSGSAPHVEGKNTAPQQMKEFSLGDAIKDAETKPTNVKEGAATEDVAPDEGPRANSAAANTSSSTSGVDKVKDKLSPSSGKENSSSGGGHARRGSVFDKLKDKLKGGKSSSSSKSP